MSHELICSWLDIPEDCWPPDHYRLLGLTPGEGDLALIEQRVHKRLDEVRRYQMMHPEQATEVMNLLAQAFVCLTEPRSKKAYDERLLGVSLGVSPVAPPPLPPPVRRPTGDSVTPAVVSGPSLNPSDLPPAGSPSVQSSVPLPPPLPIATSPRDAFAWLGNPDGAEPGSEFEEPEPEAVAVAVLDPVPKVTPFDNIRATACSQAARRGLATRRGLYQRVWATRNLLQLWYRMEKYLEDPHRRFSTNEARELYRLVEQVETATEDFPLLGDLGMPGHYILNLGQLDRTRNLRNLTYGQRELLNKDWHYGLTFLEAHRDMVRDEIAASRRRSLVARFRHALNAVVRDNPMPAALILGGIIALAIILARCSF